MMKRNLRTTSLDTQKEHDKFDPVRVMLFGGITAQGLVPKKRPL